MPQQKKPSSWAEDGGFTWMNAGQRVHTSEPVYRVFRLIQRIPKVSSVIHAVPDALIKCSCSLPPLAILRQGLPCNASRLLGFGQSRVAIPLASGSPTVAGQLHIQSGEKEKAQ